MLQSLNLHSLCYGHQTSVSCAIITEPLRGNSDTLDFMLDVWIMYELKNNDSIEFLFNYISTERNDTIDTSLSYRYTIFV